MASKQINIVLFLIIFVSLFLQLFLINRNNEPYPAILLPGGDKVFNEEKELTHTKFRIEAFSNDKSKIVSIDKLLSTVPLAYRIHIVKNKFGLPTSLNMKNINRKVVNYGRIWMEKRILNLTGFESVSHIKVTSYSVLQNLNEPDFRKQESVYSFSIPLPF